MYLSKLEALGFKSFCDKTNVVFQPGITAIVGPNGCGKSNIADAIQWALGEQSAKTLRGEKMEDVIFNGTDNRKSLGMAEVNIILTDVDGQLPAGFGEYKEIQITRRLYRSGESEYYINKMPCRLKDIRDLLIDSGIGAKAHTIIEQGRMDEILSSKPTDRRTIIEETAGIMKFKIRRNEAMNKLEATNQNLLRVNDIVNEIKRQINSLDRQAKKAEKYNKLKEEVKDIEFRLASKNLYLLESNREEIARQLTRQRDEEIGVSTEITKMERQIEEDRLLITQKESEVREIEHGILELENMIHRNEGRIEMLTGQINTFNSQLERGAVEIEDIKKEIEQQEYQHTLAKAEREQFEALLKERGALLKEKEEAYESLLVQEDRIENSLEDEKSGLFKIITDITNITNQINSHESRISETGKREDRTRTENEGLVNEYERIKGELKNTEEALASVKASLGSRKEDYSTSVKDMERMQNEIKGLEESLFAEKESLSAATVRHSSLSDMENNLTGYQEGVKKILSTKESLSGIHGIVADIIETEPKYETAIETLLGERLQNIVIETHQDAKRAVEYLRTEGGRSTFIPMKLRERRNEPYIKNGDAGIIGAALDLIKYKEGYKGVAEYLLGDALVVEDMDTAINLWQRNGINKTLVTLSGDVIDPCGALSAGNTKENGKGILHRRREIKELEQSANEKRLSVEKLEGRLGEFRAGLDSAINKKQQLESDIHQEEIRHVRAEKETQLLTDEIKRIEERLGAVNIERAAIVNERTKIEEEITSAKDNLKRFGQEREEKEAHVAELQREHRDIQAGVEDLRGEVMRLKIDVTSIHEKNENALLNIHRIEKAIEGLMNQLKNREEEINRIKDEIEESRKAIAGSESHINELSSQLNERKKIKTEKIETLTETSDKLKLKEADIKQQRKTLEELLKAISELEIKDTTLRLEIDHLKTNIFENYHISLEDVRKGLGKFSIDIEEAANALTSLKAKIDELGHVNLAAIDEYQELTQRYEFLTKQQQDLIQSMDDLQKAISKINRTTKEMFLNTFNTLNESFNEVFKSFFGGGRASLILIDENNPLESGIDILAQPSGKKLENITLLSGGEKALTAISLLFASFLIKPTPFCILDEIDAPLDEANIGRFANSLRRMTDKSQFIVITHNKRTMEMSDALYGITMEEQGVSKIVSVRFNDAKVEEPQLVG